MIVLVPLFGTLLTVVVTALIARTTYRNARRALNPPRRGRGVRDYTPYIDVERNKALNAAWDELIEIDPVYGKKWHPRLPERPNPGVIMVI